MSNVVSKHHLCPYRQTPHENLAYVVYNNGSWCYSCNKGVFKDNEFYSYKSTPSFLSINKSCNLPTNYSNIKEFSLELKAWLYRYYIFDDLIYKYSIRYCPYTYFTTAKGQVFEGESLIFPVIIDNEIVAYQQRFFPNKIFFSKNTKKHIFECGNYNTNTVVLVEDFISAIRVGEINNCIWLEGVGLTQEKISYIMKNYSNIYIWLDGDEPGQENAIKIFKKLNKLIQEDTNWYAFRRNTIRKIKNIKTDLDPKEYSNLEIRNILSEDIK